MGSNPYLTGHERVYILKAGAVTQPKGWGKEVLLCNHSQDSTVPLETGYASKFLVYNKSGAISSMHYHVKKHETFYVMDGEFSFKYYDLTDATEITETLLGGDIVVIPPMNPHQVRCVRPGSILEISTPDHSYDNYRVGKGDSQTKK